METANHILSEDGIRATLETVMDPEIPTLSIMDMGMVTSVACHLSGTIHHATITMTPTFVGCPAIAVIKKDIYDAVKKMGFDEVVVNVDMTTAWTSDRMSPEAKIKLEKFGIAPPAMMEEDMTAELLERVRCPHCHSTDTTLRSSFGSTLCRAIRFCFSCQQGFEQFKPL
jgi:ring-1,2-phenylacetyl-CoA epoxidase subunit PaaD